MQEGCVLQADEIVSSEGQREGRRGVGVVEEVEGGVGGICGAISKDLAGVLKFAA